MANYETPRPRPADPFASGSPALQLRSKGSSIHIVNWPGREDAAGPRHLRRHWAMLAAGLRTMPTDYLFDVARLVGMITDTYEHG